MAEVILRNHEGLIPAATNNIVVCFNIFAYYWAAGSPSIDLLVLAADNV